MAGVEQDLIDAWRSSDAIANTRAVTAIMWGLQRHDDLIHRLFADVGFVRSVRGSLLDPADSSMLSLLVVASFRLDEPGAAYLRPILVEVSASANAEVAARAYRWLVSLALPEDEESVLQEMYDHPADRVFAAALSIAYYQMQRHLRDFLTANGRFLLA